MELKFGTKVLVRANAEEMQSELFQKIDGARGEISEVYHTIYEPDVTRIEVTLDHAVEVNDEKLKVVPGLYEDNIESYESESPDEKSTEPETKDEPEELGEDDSEIHNQMSENRPMRTFQQFNESIERDNEQSWYYGLADCHGIESFIKEPYVQDWQDVDDLFDIGLMPTTSVDDPEKRKYNTQIGLLKIRAHHNVQKWPVIYRAKLNKIDVQLINDLIDDQDYEEALRMLKNSAETIQLARGLGGNAERRWNQIPNPELNPV